MYDFESTGTILYDPYRGGMKRNTQNWCIVDVDKDITRYYRYWVDKMIRNPLGLKGQELYQPSWNAHISVVRGESIPKSRQHLWKKYHKQKLTFQYSHEPIETPNKKFWIVYVHSPEITQIRTELGLQTKHRHHLTIGRIYDHD